jgi:hypothetical protein
MVLASLGTIRLWLPLAMHQSNTPPHVRSTVASLRATDVRPTWPHRRFCGHLAGTRETATPAGKRSRSRPPAT